MKYLIGIDGGGTKTAFLLASEDGTIIRSERLATTNHTQCGFVTMLTTIPLLIFALISPAVGSLLHRIGMKNLFLICILSIFTGILMRSYCGFWGLLTGTAFLGFGIGILNVLIPVWIRRDFPERIGPVMD